MCWLEKSVMTTPINMTMVQIEIFNNINKKKQLLPDVFSFVQLSLALFSIKTSEWGKTTSLLLLHFIPLMRHVFIEVTKKTFSSSDPQTQTVSLIASQLILEANWLDLNSFGGEWHVDGSTSGNVVNVRFLTH